MKAIPAFIFSIVLSSLAQAQTAKEIMESVRQVAVLQKEQILTGVIRKGVKKTPLNLFLKGKDIQFTLNDGTEGFHLRLEDDKQELWDITNGKAKKFPVSKIGASVANTDLTYEDLALKFLYWPNPNKYEGGKIGLEDCWRIHIVNPEKSGSYREVSVWVTKKHRALARVVGYGPRPARRPLKQFEIIDVMKVNGVFTVETMKVSRFDEKRRVIGDTYLEFDKPKRRGR
ncbi:outer membrane lipoprotein-sorting protein [Akkermansiaceae bacterium]|nr:outer membrane lipoprotein-sorting protein [Akkermansiaceae bacterium]MDA7929958.1 outer membrane lipoprotein-sorting protein [Akkermansiaceae bacterium]MDB4465552.1 outer membrane lipoprotein-sorting protein [Akkermansiaceae bacterium]MDB4509371.1 outer membrane lipoprotein-sorting protein [Akkermansiaceae bacterium]MDB4809160.1 outer membrane lipoprotein-sorting protein [bacterium]